MKFYSYLAVAIFCKFAVPLFFMISGAVLLGKEETVKEILKKRVGKILVILASVTLIYYVDALVFDKIPFEGWSNIPDFFGRLLDCSVIIHLWYLYSYIVFLLVLPFFRMLVKGMNKSMITYFCALALIFNCVIPVVQYLLFQGKYEIYASFSLFTMKNIAAPFIGYWLWVCLDYDQIKNKHIVFLWLINLACIALSCVMTHIRIVNAGQSSGYAAEDFFSTFAPVNAITIFITVKKCCKPSMKDSINKLVTTIAGATFGAYLFHLLSFRASLLVDWVAMLATKKGMPMIGWLAVTGIYFVINVVFVLIIKKIPIIKKYL